MAICSRGAASVAYEQSVTHSHDTLLLCHQYGTLLTARLFVTYLVLEETEIETPLLSQKPQKVCKPTRPDQTDTLLCELAFISWPYHGPGHINIFLVSCTILLVLISLMCLVGRLWVHIRVAVPHGVGG